MKKSFLDQAFDFFERLEVYQIVLIFFAMFLAAYLALSVFFGTASFFVIVVSGSMEPALSRGDVVFLSAYGQPENNDIIAFKKNNDIIIHRVVQITPAGFKTKGDRNPLPDSYIVPKSSVVGNAVFVVPQVGHLNLFLAGK